MLILRTLDLSRFVGHLLCLLVVAALMSTPLGRVAHARATAHVPVQGLHDGSAPAPVPCEDAGGCKFVCRNVGSKLLGLWRASPRVPEPFESHALVPFVSVASVHPPAVAARAALARASQSQAAYLLTLRLRL